MAPPSETDTRRGRRGLAIAGTVLVVALLLLSLLADGLVALTALGHAPAPMLWLFQWHPALVLVAAVAIVWQWRLRSAWLLALAVALVPFVAAAALLLL
jgi:hypothetical protein